MRVRIICSIAGTPMYQHGDIVDLPPEVSAAWIRAGLALPLVSEAPQRHIAPERATAEPEAETAVTQLRKGRGR